MAYSRILPDNWWFHKNFYTSMEKPGKKGAQLQVYHVLIFKYQHPNVFLMAVVSTAESSIQCIRTSARSSYWQTLCSMCFYFSILRDEVRPRGYFFDNLWHVPCMCTFFSQRQKSHFPMKVLTPFFLVLRVHCCCRWQNYTSGQMRRGVH